MILGALSATFSFWSYQVNSLGIATILLFTTPIWTVIFGRIFLGEKLNKWDLANIAAIILLTVLLLYNPASGELNENVS